MAFKSMFLKAAEYKQKHPEKVPKLLDTCSAGVNASDGFNASSFKDKVYNNHDNEFFNAINFEAECNKFIKYVYELHLVDDIKKYLDVSSFGK